MFGDDPFNGLPLSIYAEHLFYSGMKQLVKGYDGDSFDFVKITEANDFDFEQNGVFPYCDDCDNELSMRSRESGMNIKVSIKSSSFIVWVLVIEQIFNKLEPGKTKTKLMNIFQDFMYSYSRMVDKDNIPLFNEDEKYQIYKYLD
ncbi:hypothetical protein [Psychromonas aquatilis]|uniref:Immunity protein 42 of polymorphic toxin system n=1 Tax=Psychromonas aquatilis TaxID=2005072 RepID=A0ABU9GRJ2_9GAMM